MKRDYQYLSLLKVGIIISVFIIDWRLMQDKLLDS